MSEPKKLPEEKSEIARNNARKPHERLWRKHPTGICGIPGCGGKHFMKDLCARHYMRVRRTGSVGPVGKMRGAKKKTLEGFEPLVARPPQLATPRAQKAAEMVGMSRVQRERERRVRILAACVEEHGLQIKYTLGGDGSRCVFTQDGKTEIATEWAVSSLVAAGFLVDNRAGVLVLAARGSETLSERGLAPGRVAADGLGKLATEERQTLSEEVGPDG